MKRLIMAVAVLASFSAHADFEKVTMPDNAIYKGYTFECPNGLNMLVAGWNYTSGDSNDLLNDWTNVTVYKNNWEYFSTENTLFNGAEGYPLNTVEVNNETLQQIGFAHVNGFGNATLHLSNYKVTYATYTGYVDNKGTFKTLTCKLVELNK